MQLFLINDIFTPQLLAVEKDFLLVYKPPRMHSVPRSTGGETILDWCLTKLSEVALLPGRREGEGGLLHRLDYGTHGLMLIARNSGGMEALLEQQRNGKIVKGYSALVAKGETVQKRFKTVRNIFSLLSRREAEILSLVKDGLSNKQIAGRLGISQRTVENTLSCIYDKTGIRSRLELQRL